MASSRSHFLDLPLELRLHIYDYALAEPTAISISTSAVGCADSTEQDDATHSIPGLPSNHVPVIRYFTEVSSKSDSTMVPLLPQALQNNTEDEEDSAKKSHSTDDEVQLPFSVPFALMQTNRQTYAELTNHLSRHRKLNLSANTSFSESQNSSRQTSFISSSSFASNTSNASFSSTSTTSSRRTRDSPLCRPGAGLRLHVTYPYGILVLKHKYPALLHQATEISITGCYTTHSPGSFSRSWRTQMDPSIRDPPPDTTVTAARRALRRMTHTVLSPEPSPLLQKYSMRIFVPDAARCHTKEGIWGEKSPVSVGLTNICGGEIDILVKRGQVATAIEMTVIPCPKVRAITCRHVKLDEKEYLDSLDHGTGKPAPDVKPCAGTVA